MNPFRIERQFHGPPTSGNGGYVSGRLAAYIDGPAVVRLLMRPPLDTAMDVCPVDGGIELMHGSTRVATARQTEPLADVPRAPGYGQVEAASLGYRGFLWHPFPTCFVCGPARDPGDGLRIFAGPVPGTRIVAAPWIPHASLGSRGVVSPEFVWAALDCPGAFSFESSEGTALLLGEIAATLLAPVRIGNRHIAAGWEIDRKDRRHYTGTAIFTESGECLALARSTWFEVPATP
ncbi:MAG TPA: hypothetical protein VD839_01130 [Burkholderiales bacterium]|jgi:hypothetical protein|nr:hypothetical protein [Burkholderiales bacterium]